MPAVSGRALRTAVAIVCAAWLGLAATYAADPLADALRWGFDHVRPGDLYAWVVVLGVAAALVAFTREEARLRRWLAGARGRLGALGRLGRALGATPAGVTLPLVVAASFAVRVALDRGASLPRIFGDELIYSGLAKSLALGDGLGLRGDPAGLGYGPLYPLLVSPVYRLAEDGASAFFTIQTLNALLMSLTAVPAYYLARRVVSQGWSLAVAALSVAVPAMAYTSLVMTEALFYPGFVAASLALTLALERPTPLRQAVLVGAILALGAVRVQAAVFVPALATAVLVDAVRLRVGVVAHLRRFATAWALLGGVAIAALVAYEGDPRGPLGAYGVLVRGYSVLETVKWLVWNVAVLEVSLGFVALAAFVVAVPLLLRRSANAREGAFGATALGVTVWTTLSVALLSASPYGLDRLHWRSLFVVIPLVLVCFAWWLAAGLPRPGVLTLGTAAAALALPLAVPWRQVELDVVLDSPATRVWKELGELAPVFTEARVIVPLAALAIATFLLARSAVLPIASLVLAFAAVTAALDWEAELPRERAERLAWVDRALPAGAEALLVHFDLPKDGCPQLDALSRQRDLVRMTEFFNASITRVVNIWGQVVHDGLASEQITIGADGSLRDEGAEVPARYAVADSRVTLAGRRVTRLDARSLEGPWLPRPTGSLTLWQTDGPVRLADPAQLQGASLAQLSCRPADTV